MRSRGILRASALVQHLALSGHTPKVISPSDPQSAWTAKANKRVQFGYGLNYLIDVKNAVIVDVEATPARTYDEVAATQTMLDRKRFGLKPKRLAADTAYGTGKFLGWLVKVSQTGPRARELLCVITKFLTQSLLWGRNRELPDCAKSRGLLSWRVPRPLRGGSHYFIYCSERRVTFRNVCANTRERPYQGFLLSSRQFDQLAALAGEACFAFLDRLDRKRVDCDRLRCGILVD